MPKYLVGTKIKLTKTGQVVEVIQPKVIKDKDGHLIQIMPKERNMTINLQLPSGLYKLWGLRLKARTPKQYLATLKPEQRNEIEAFILNK